MTGRFVRSSLLAGLAAFGLYSCAPLESSGLRGSSPTATSGALTRVDPSIWPSLRDPVPTDPQVEERIAEFLAAMSLEQKVGQIIQADIGSVTPEQAAAYHLGSVLNGGNSAPGGKPFATGPEWLAAAEAFYKASTRERPDGTPVIPIIWGSDAVHGHNNVIGATIFPHNIGLGAMRDPELMRRIGEVTAVEMRVTGLDWTFAPTLAVPRDDRWGRTYEGFSEDPDIVASYAAPLVEGLQGKIGDQDWLRGDHIVATAKHFVGDGATNEGRDQGDSTVSEESLRDVQAAGYIPAIEAGVQSVMVSFSSWHGEKLTAHRPLLTDVLKGRMDFGGFLVGDWNAHGQVEECTNTSCAGAIDAGLDMFMAPDSWRGLYDNTLAQARSGLISRERLDDAVARILRVKLRSGLMDADPPSERPNAGRFELLGSPEHRAVAREAVRRSLVLLKNESATLPLRSGQRVLVAGDGADDIGKQSGGWTLTWQGTDTARSDFPGATSIWQGLREVAEANGAEAVLSEDGSYAERPDVAVIVFGEDPYAEFQGDVPDLAFRDEHDTLGMLRQFQDAGIPTVSIFLSGRPLWVNPYLNASDAFVAAWLPGSEAGGIADVLFGQADFTGRLSYSWPRSPLQTPLNAGDPDYDPLFPLGYGLNYASEGTVPRLPEDSGVETSVAAPGTLIFARGDAGSGYRLVAQASGRTVPISELAETPLPSLAADRVDLAAQEDAWRFSWSGRAAVSAVPDVRLDWTRESNGDFLLALDLRRGESVPDAVTLSLECGTGCAGRLNIAPALRALEPGVQGTLAVPLRCFVGAGADAARLTTAASIDTAGPLVLDIGRIALVSDDGASRSCPAGETPGVPSPE